MERCTNQRTLTAYHEAGHAVASIVVGSEFKQVTIVADERSKGRVHHGGFDDDMWMRLEYIAEDDVQARTIMEHEIIVFFAGMIAEDLKFGEYDVDGAASDEGKITDLLNRTDMSMKETELFRQWLWTRTRKILSNPLHAVQVDAVAHALLERGTLGYGDTRRICNDVSVDICQLRIQRAR